MFHIVNGLLSQILKLLFEYEKRKSNLKSDFQLILALKTVLSKI